MNSRLVTHVAWALLVLVAFIFGRFFAAGDNAATGGGTAPASLTLISPTPEAAAKDSLPAATPGLSGPDIRVRMFNVLSLPSRRERLGQLCELLAQVSPQNWRDVVDAFVTQNAKVGRRNQEEWRLMLEHVGEVAGLAAIEETMESKVPADRARMAALLTGWAAADPKASKAWFDALDPEEQTAFRSGIVLGLARSDPAAAAFLNIKSPAGEPRDSLFYHIMDAVFQSGGVKAGDDLISAMRARKEPVGSVYFHQATRVVEVARMREAPQEVLDWADRNMGPSGAGPSAMRAIVSFAAQADPANTMKWVTDRTERWTEQQAPVIFPIVASELLKRDPDQFTGWMNAHPDHPQRDAMAAAAAEHYINVGNLEAASNWVQSIGETKMRSEHEANVQRSQQRAAEKPPLIR